MPSRMHPTRRTHTTGRPPRRLIAGSTAATGSGTFTDPRPCEGRRKYLTPSRTQPDLTPLRPRPGRTEYYNSSWQIVETRKAEGITTAALAKTTVAADTHCQYIWDGDLPGHSLGGGRYIDSPILRDENTDPASDNDCTDIGGSERLYYLNDANFNVTALVDTSGSVVERYTYDAYGQPAVYNASWTAITEAASKDNAIRFCGYVYDAGVGLYHVRHRTYHPTLGRWLQRDPAGYVDGMNVYEYCMSDPLLLQDSLGLQGKKELSGLVKLVLEAQEELGKKGKLVYGNIGTLKKAFKEKGAEGWTQNDQALLEKTLANVLEYQKEVRDRYAVIRKQAQIDKKEIPLEGVLFINQTAARSYNRAVMRIRDKVQYRSGVKATFMRPRIGMTKDEKFDYATFKGWYLREKASGIEELFLRLLPGCPCRISVKNGKACAPAGGKGILDGPEWDEPTKADQEYHPGAVWAMRLTHTVDVRDKLGRNLELGQQCTYDVKGMLITEPPAAGTADSMGVGSGIKVSGVPVQQIKNALGGHAKLDVAPYNQARRLDRLFGSKFFTNAYFDVRPAMNKDGCPYNGK